MVWYNDANFRSKGGDRLNTMVTSKNVNLMKRSYHPYYP